MKKKEIVNYLTKELEAILLFSFSEHDNIIIGYGEWCLIIFSQLLDKYLIEKNYTFKKPKLEQLKKIELKDAINNSNSPLTKNSLLGSSIKEKKGGKLKFDKSKIIQQLDKLDSNKLDNDHEYFSKLIQGQNEINIKVVEVENIINPSSNSSNIEIFQNFIFDKIDDMVDNKYKHLKLLKNECNKFNSKYNFNSNSNSDNLFSKTTKTFLSVKSNKTNIASHSIKNPILNYVEIENILIQSIIDKEKRVFKNSDLSDINDKIANMNSTNKKINDKTKTFNQIKANVKCLEHNLKDKIEKIELINNKINSVEPAVIENKENIKLKVSKLTRDIINLSLITSLKLVRLNSFYVYTSKEINNNIIESYDNLFDEEI